MVILIGGSGHTGKTYMAQQLLEKYKYPYLSIDHLKMGLYRADIGCGFTPCDDDEKVSEVLWGVLCGMIKTNIENKQNIIIEGCYLLPQNINRIEAEYQKSIISFFIGFSESYIEKNYHSEILQHRNVIEARGYENDFSADEFILQNRKIKELCQKHNAKYFEVTHNYGEKIEEIYKWLDHEMSKALIC